jgi:hypothetical protein
MIKILAENSEKGKDRMLTPFPGHPMFTMPRGLSQWLSSPPMSDKLQFCAVRVVRIIDDKLPQMLVAVDVEVDEFYGQASPPEPDDGSLYIDVYRVFGPAEVDRDPAGGPRGWNGIANGQADAAHADVDSLLGSDDTVLRPYLHGGVEGNADELSFFSRPGNHGNTSHPFWG